MAMPTTKNVSVLALPTTTAAKMMAMAAKTTTAAKTMAKVGKQQRHQHQKTQWQQKQQRW